MAVVTMKLTHLSIFQTLQYSLLIVSNVIKILLEKKNRCNKCNGRGFQSIGDEQFHSDISLCAV